MTELTDSGGAVFKVVPIEWDGPQADPARAIRMQVFVEEQKVPAEMELDEVDPEAVHVLALDRSGVACGTGRLFAEAGEPGIGHIGRMAVLPATRGRGCGAAILCALLDEARRIGYTSVVLTAQSHALGFYEKHGFSAYGEDFMEAGIPHRWMRAELRT